MFFVLSKTLDLLLDPLSWVLFSLGVTFAALWRGKGRVAVSGLVAASVVLVFFSSPVVANRLWHSLEADAPRTYRAEATYDVVVLLGGAVTPSGATAEQVAWGDNVDRLTVTYELLKSGRARAAIVSGGHFNDALPTEAEYLSRQLVGWGIEPERVIVEPTALNTYENATASKAILEARGLRKVLVVTSAFHMTRALDCFRAVGLDPDALPVDYRMRDPSASSGWLPRTRFLNESTDALREYAGRIVYRLTGRARRVSA